MPRKASKNFPHLASDDDIEAMFTQPQAIREPRSMIETLTFTLSWKEQDHIKDICKDIYNQYGFLPSKAQITLITKKLYWRKSE
jgi:hypothetical protein